MTEHEERPTRQRITLTDISSRAWEHPADRGALVALRSLKGFDFVLRKMSGLVNERAFRLQYLGSAIRVDERQFPKVHRLYTEAATTLDVRTLPELYVINSPIWNAVTIGMDKPFIVLNSALLQGLDDEETRFILGHELGHAQSGHALYQSLLLWLMRLTGAVNWMPIGALGLRAIIAALHEWSRKAELSGDRAGLLAVQDPAVALRVQMKLASGGQLAELDTTAFLAQGTEYEGAGDLRDSVLKLLLLEAQTHPLAVIRAHELRRWVDEGEYTTIVSGTYPKRQEDGDASMTQEAKNAAKSYSDAFARSQDPLAKLLRDAGDGLGGVRDWVSSKFPPR
ncbi:Zn-dependent protease with chaperone function [Kribbella sp. VKM Ac-2527]|uniref:Zn-dependent protease with chaperone function n=1 Tax=Kribbella caucasensis TaxID=2512215 RepID=A0A4R6K2U5_9ACTN|nr:M48 family metallopeptidase [Kribbella sp. VKM Ac-2527]TDO43157.1 Zn-dependent protease with chaperone function [Kribbella sp. VKM Ac-2527]